MCPIPIPCNWIEASQLLLSLFTWKLNLDRLNYSIWRACFCDCSVFERVAAAAAVVQQRWLMTTIPKHIKKEHINFERRQLSGSCHMKYVMIPVFKGNYYDKMLSSWQYHLREHVGDIIFSTAYPHNIRSSRPYCCITCSIQKSLSGFCFINVNFQWS